MARRIILFIHSTLNGVVTGDPDGDKTDFSGWTRPGNVVGEASESLLRLFDRVDTVLLGRATYDDLSRKWPTMQAATEPVDVVSRLAAKINGATKLVATRDDQVAQLPWGECAPAEPLGGDLAERLQRIRAGEGGDVVIFGSPTLVRSLMEADLIDELHIVVHPVVVEVGERLFSGVETRTDLTLESATTFSEGGVLLAYGRAVA
ncbi:dihydrofolate reductase family protein [Georgenia subflava]|uniref:Bacterial bifunctional deaminase-reductase C-terminal domain-containing protein n=1 Tax=Georgenia subflava TaxID=1622177 RepID=A0A6N7EFE4_9MICO|nr:dihydrofolate reductase family protein [Georgenia subflava]MPV35913.1 hypothetical protein [Georgenia subflava]